MAFFQKKLETGLLVREEVFDLGVVGLFLFLNFLFFVATGSSIWGVLFRKCREHTTEFCFIW